MIRKRWTKALAGIFLVWSIISIYFYFQHRVSVTVINIPGWELDVNNNKIVQIKQIRTYDWERKESYHTIWERWQPVLEIGNILPNGDLRIKYLHAASKILYFYSSPYEKLDDDSRRIDVSGVLINSEQPNGKWPWIQISVNNEPVTRDGTELSSSSNRNMHFFTANGIIRNLEQEIDSIELHYHVEFDTPNPDLKTKSLKVRKDDKKNYGFFNPVPSKYSFMGLATPVEEFIKKLQDEKQQAKAMISDRVVDFPWNNMLWKEEQKDELIVHCTANNYLGDYKNFNNVFIVNVAYMFKDEKNHDQRVRDDDIVATQIIYVIEEEGQWKIVDASPLNKTAYHR